MLAAPLRLRTAPSAIGHARRGYATKGYMLSLKARVEAGMAKSGPPLSAIVASNGLDLMSVVKDFNAKTKEISPVDLPIRIHKKGEKQHVLEVRPPSWTQLLWSETEWDSFHKIPPEKLYDVVRVRMDFRKRVNPDDPYLDESEEGMRKEFRTMLSCFKRNQPQ